MPPELFTTRPATTWVSGGLCLLPEGDGHRAAYCDLEIADGRIAAVHPTGQHAKAGPPDQIIDAQGLLVTPGLINAHSHSPDNLMVGTAPALPLELWSIACAGARESLTAREAYLSTLLGCIEMLRSGTTTVLDHVRFPEHLDPACLDGVAQAYRDAGMRAIVAPVVADQPLAQTLPLAAADFLDTAVPGGAASSQMPATEQVARVADFHRRWHGVEGRLQCAIGPSGPQRCSDALLEQSAGFAKAHGVLLHTHVLETRIQQAMAHRLYGVSMVRHLDDIGLLGPGTNLVHAIWIDGEDLDLIARSGATVVHNPISNARLGSGMCPVPALLRRGVPVALGTDSACCNDGNHLLETAKWATLLHNLHSPDPADWLSPHTAFRLATREGANVLGLGAVTGAIAPGFAADLAFFDLKAPGLVPLNDPIQQLVLSHAGARAAQVMVAGRTVVRDGRSSSFSEEDVWAEAQAFSDRRNSRAARAAENSHPLTQPIFRMHRRIHGLTKVIHG